MRRADREVTDSGEIKEIIASCRVLRMAMAGGEYPYVVPMNFGVDFSGARAVFYMYCAKEGRKLDCLARDARVALEMDCAHALIEGKTACAFGFRYASVLAFGRAELVEDETEKARALGLIMLCQTGRDDFSFSPEALARVAVLRVRAEEITAKRRQ